MKRNFSLQNAVVMTNVGHRLVESLFIVNTVLCWNIHIFVSLSRPDTLTVLLLFFLIGRKPWEAFSDVVALVH